MTDNEFPKMIYAPDGAWVIVDDAAQEAAQMAAWGVQDAQPSDEAEESPVRRRGRPPKDR